MAAGDLITIPFSNTSDFLPIKVGAIATPGTLIHSANATDLDEVWIWFYNSDTVSREVTVEYGGTTNPDQTKKKTIPPKDGDWLVIPGHKLQNSLSIRAFGAAANVLMASGYVVRRSAS